MASAYSSDSTAAAYQLRHTNKLATAYKAVRIIYPHCRSYNYRTTKREEKKMRDAVTHSRTRAESGRW